MTWGEKYNKIIERNQDICVKEFIASKTSQIYALVQCRDGRYRCTFCGNVVIGDSQYCPECGAQFYDLYYDDDNEDYAYENE